MHNLHFSPCSWSPALCGLISYAGSSGSGQAWVLAAEWPYSLQGQALYSRSPGANPLPCLPASVNMSKLWLPYVKL